MKWFVLLTLVFVLLAIPAVTFAQDTTPTPAPVPVTPTNPLSVALAYVVVLFTTLPLWSGSVFLGVEVAKKQIQRMLAYFEIEDYPIVRSFITLAAVVVASWQAVTQLGYNIFTLPNAPHIAMSADEQKYATVAVVALASIAIHLITTYRGKLGALNEIATGIGLKSK